MTSIEDFMYSSNYEPEILDSLRFSSLSTLELILSNYIIKINISDKKFRAML